MPRCDGSGETGVEAPVVGVPPDVIVRGEAFVMRERYAASELSLQVIE